MSFVCQYVNFLYAGNKINCKFGNKCVCYLYINLVTQSGYGFSQLQTNSPKKDEEIFLLLEVFVYFYVYLCIFERL